MHNTIGPDSKRKGFKKDLSNTWQHTVLYKSRFDVKITRSFSYHTLKALPMRNLKSLAFSKISIADKNHKL